MPTDLTGTPTQLGIGTYNTSADAPSGLGFNAAMAQIDALLPGHFMTTTGDIIYASGVRTPARLGIGSTGNVLTVAGGLPTWAAPSGGVSVVDYVEFNSNKSGSVDIVTGAGFTADGVSFYLIEFWAPGYQGPNAGAGTISVNLKEGATDLGIVYEAGFSVWGSGNIQSQYGVYGARRFIPSAAAHTYKFSMSGSGTILAGAGGAATAMPGYIKITKGL